MSEPNGRVPVPLASTVRLVPRKYCRFPLTYWRYCRFPLTYWGSKGPSLCLVEVIAADPGRNAPATVVLHGLRTDCGSSLDYSIARAAMAVADLVPATNLDPSRARWVQAPEDEEDTWREVTFESCTYSEEDRRWQFSNPSWQGTEPVRFDEASDDPDVFYATEYRPIPAGDPVELRLNETKCHERRTGRCSLEIEEPADDELGADDERDRASWGYCRRLADLASLWLFVKEHFPESHDTLDYDAAAAAAQQGWRPLYGTIDAVKPATVSTAYQLYQDKIEAGWIENRCWSFQDGQHRWCASRHAGLDLPIKLHVVRPRLDSGTAPCTSPDDE